VSLGVSRELVRDADPLRRLGERGVVASDCEPNALTELIRPRFRLLQSGGRLRETIRRQDPSGGNADFETATQDRQPIEVTPAEGAQARPH